MNFFRRRLIGSLLLIAALLLLWIAWPQLRDSFVPYLEASTWRRWREWIRSFGVLAPLVSVLLSVAQIVPLPIPAPAIPLANGWLFGIWSGTLVTWLGVVLNGILGYVIARGPGRRLFVRLISERNLVRAEKALDEHGALAVVIARMFPVLPFSAISIAAGLLDMRWRVYIMATALGVLPSAFALALIGWQLHRGEVDWFQVSIGVGILALLGLLAIPLTRWYQDDRRQKGGERRGR